MWIGPVLKKIEGEMKNEKGHDIRRRIVQSNQARSERREDWESNALNK